jgi:catechol 2,3-dioxygenase-like lactoylglutathione lyase family enzyme
MDAPVCHHPVTEMTLRVEIFPDDLDTTADFYTKILGFTVTKGQRAEPTAYVSLERGKVRIAAARRAVPDLRARRLPLPAPSACSRLTMSLVSGTGWQRRAGRWLRISGIAPGA